jgi:hypothetical protein
VGPPLSTARPSGVRARRSSRPRSMRSPQIRVVDWWDCGSVDVVAASEETQQPYISAPGSRNARKATASWDLTDRDRESSPMYFAWTRSCSAA